MREIGAATAERVTALVKDAQVPALEHGPRGQVRGERRLFTDEGYGATSLDAIVAACGVTKGSLYHHFGTAA